MTLPNNKAVDFRHFLYHVKLLYRWATDMPSIQLAEWAEANLPQGVYRVRFRADENFEITSGAIGPGGVIATWPNNGIVGSPVPEVYAVALEPLPPAQDPRDTTIVSTAPMNLALLASADAPLPVAEPALDPP